MDAITPRRLQRSNSVADFSNNPAIARQDQTFPVATTGQTSVVNGVMFSTPPQISSQPDFSRRRTVPNHEPVNSRTSNENNAILVRPASISTAAVNNQQSFMEAVQHSARPFFNASAPEFTPRQHNLYASEVNNNVQMPTTPDSWIFETNEYNRRGRSRHKPPKLQLMSFDGNPLNWPMFIQNFRVQIHDAVDTDEERIAHLNNCLPTWIRAQMGRLLMHAGLYRQALAELYKRYGSQQVIAKTCSSTLEKLRPFGDDDYKGLSHFSATLNSVVATLQLCGFSAELHSYATVASLLTRISPKLLDRWSIKTWEAQPSVPTLDDFATFIDNACMAEYSKRIGGGPPAPQRAPRATTAAPPMLAKPAVYAIATENECPVCKAKHSLANCKQFQQLKSEKRAEIVRKSSACLRCLNVGHRGNECTREKACGAGGCKKLHHPLLHDAPRLFPAKRSTSDSADNSHEFSSHFTGATLAATVTLLPIVPITLKANGRRVETFAFLDQGSEVTLLKADVAKALRLDGPAFNTSVQTVNGSATQKLVKLPELTATSRDNSASFRLHGAYSIENLIIANKSRSVRNFEKSWSHLKGITFQSPDPGQIAILIGADQPAAIEILEYRKDPLNQRAPRGIRTHFGWCIAGPATENRKSSFSCHRTFLPGNADEDDPLLKAFRQFIAYDAYGENRNRCPPLSAQAARAIEIMTSSIKHVDGHYEVGIPFQDDQPNLPINQKDALRHLFWLEKRLLRDATLCKRYVAGMQETIALGHARKLTSAEVRASTPGRAWYNTHHPVINPKKPEKLRIVFNLAAVFSGVSLNSKLLKGPDLTSSLVGVLMRLRTQPVAVVADIEKMFHQVRVPRRDRDVLRFFWRMPASNDPPGVY